MKYLLRNFYFPVQEKYQKKLLHKTVFVKIFKFIKKKTRGYICIKWYVKKVYKFLNF